AECSQPAKGSAMIGYVLWALLVAGMLVVEGLGLTLRGNQWPTVSDLFRSATRPTLGRWLLFACWLWLGWHFFIQGWKFFLRGRGARSPRHPMTGKTLRETLVEVVGPLLGVFVLLASVITASARARFADRPTPFDRARGVPPLQLA